MFPRATRSTILNYQHENSSLHNENGYPHECNMNIFCVKRTATFVLSYATLHYITLHYTHLVISCIHPLWKNL